MGRVTTEVTTQRMEIFGHRGAAGLLPENTLPGFRRAAELGCSGVECDVWAVDGELAVIHDATVDRTTNGHGSLDELGVAGLRELDAGGAPVPLAEDLLPLLAEYPALLWNVELKDVVAAGLLRRRVVDWPAGVVARMLVSSFLPDALAPWVGAGLPVALCVDKVTPKGLSRAQSLGCAAVHMALGRLRPEVVARVRNAGMAVRVFTVNDEAICRRLAAIGVQGVFTDRPDLLVGNV